MIHDRIIGSIMALLGLVTGLMTVGWPGGLSGGFASESLVLTPYFFPRMVSMAMVLCGLWIGFLPKNRDTDISLRTTVRMGMVTIGFFAGAFIARWDFFIATVLLGTLILRLSKASLIISVTYATIVGGCIFFIFRYLFDLHIPSVIL